MVEALDGRVALASGEIVRVRQRCPGMSVDRSPCRARRGRPTRTSPTSAPRRRTAPRSRRCIGATSIAVYGYSFYLLGDHHDAEDATERTFMAALGAIDRYRDEGSTFRSWLFRIAHNQLANALRARSRHRTASLDAVPEPAAADDPARLAGIADDARRLRAAVASLSEDRRQVMILRFVDGLSAREIGDVLGRSEGAVRVLQHRALRELAALLERRSPTDGRAARNRLRRRAAPRCNVSGSAVLAGA